jgi:hypothetical protein
MCWWIKLVVPAMEPCLVCTAQHASSLNHEGITIAEPVLLGLLLLLLLLAMA